MAKTLESIADSRGSLEQINSRRGYIMKKQDGWYINGGGEEIRMRFEAVDF